jgi:hypothetical protein
MNATIEIDGLRKRFGPAQALDEMTFTVRPGQVTGAGRLCVKPAGYIGGGWRASRSKVLDNVVIGYCKLNKITPAGT